MDVTCERCQTAYEFDETLVSDKGTTVKCTNCGHLFRIFRASAMPPPGAAAGPAPRPWILRRKSGEQSTFAELSTLQQWILDGKVDRDDEISRTGEVWKRLGTIAELATFFAAAEAARPAAAPERPRTKTPPGGFATDKQSIGVLPTMRVERKEMTPPPVAPAPLSGTSLGLGGKPGTLASPAVPASIRSIGTSTAELDQTLDWGGDMVVAPTERVRGPSTASFGIPSEPPKPPAAAFTVPAKPAPAPASIPAAAPVATKAPTPSRDTASFPEVPRAVPQTAFPIATASKEISSTQLGAGVAAMPDLGPRIGTIPTTMGSGEPIGGVGSIRPSAAGPAWEAEPSSIPARRSMDDVAPERRSSRRMGPLLLVVGLVVVVGYVAVFQQSAIARLFGGEPAEETDTADPGTPFVLRGNERTLQDTDDAFAEASAELTKALAFRDDDPRALAGLATIASLQALAAQDDARDAEALMARGGADAAAQRVRADARRAEATRQIETAKRHVDVASRSREVDPTLRRATALVRALEERIGEARAAATEAGHGPETDFVLGVIAERDSGPGAAEAGARYEAAVRAMPGLHRARVRFARVLAARGDAAGARAQLDEVLRGNPGHARAKALQDAIGRGEPPLPQAVASGTGARPAGATAAPSEGDHEGVPHDQNGQPIQVPSGRGFDYYIAQAESAREHGQCDRAIPLYEEALTTRPGSSEALAGLGHCQLSRGDANGAVTRFLATIQVNPSYALAHFGLADAYRRLGRRRDAIHEYQEFLALVSSGGRADAARAAIADLQGGGGGGDGGGGAATSQPATSAPQAPPTGSSELPAPLGTPPGSGVIQQSDSLTEGSEPPLRPGEHL